MLMLMPRSVKFGATTIESVTAVAIDRAPDKLIADRGDGGPHITFADVPEQRVTVSVRQHLIREDVTDLKPGASGTLAVWTAPAASETARRKLSGVAVLLSSETELRSGASAASGVVATRVLRFLMVSADGAADAITITDAGAEI
ncbi:MAG: hypothetical protein HEQ23_03080 [Tepidisphaera sp.]